MLRTSKNHLRAIAKGKVSRFLRQLDENGFPQLQDFGFRSADVEDFNVENQIRRNALRQSTVSLQHNTPTSAADAFEKFVGNLPTPDPTTEPTPVPTPEPTPEPTPSQSSNS